MDNNDAVDTALAFPNATIIRCLHDMWSRNKQNEKDFQESYKVTGIGQRLKILEAI